MVANGDGSWKWPLTRKFAWYSPYAELYGGDIIVLVGTPAAAEAAHHLVTAKE